MKDFLRKELYCYKIHNLLIKSSAYPPPSFYRHPLWFTMIFKKHQPSINRGRVHTRRSPRRSMIKVCDTEAAVHGCSIKQLNSSSGKFRKGQRTKTVSEFFFQKSCKPQPATSLKKKKIQYRYLPQNFAKFYN